MAAAPLTDKLRAAVFVRDKAICAFSGHSLWILDHGAAPGWDMDWPDHVRPASRGGKSTLDNLVCASFSHNSKKRNNGADNAYLFLNGKPTYFYWEMFGRISPMLASRMRREFVAADWYFNRAVANTLVALKHRYFGLKRTRTARYWFGSALKRLEAHRDLASTAPSMRQRGLVGARASEDVRLLLSLRAASNVNEISDIADRLYPIFAKQHDLFYRFVEAKTAAQRAAIVRSLPKQRGIGPTLKAKLKASDAALEGIDDALADRDDG
jgi:hypothetical protein